MNETFISVDIEASGPIPGEYSLLSIGACAVYEPAREFSCLFQPISTNADPQALEVTGLQLEELMVRGLAPEAAMKEFAQWVQEITAGSTPVFVGLNASFDWSFVNYYFHRFVGNNPFGFTALDIKSLFMGASGCSWHDTRSSNMKRILSAKSEGTHDALEDARYQAELFRLIRSSLSVSSANVASNSSVSRQTQRE
jgi:DNA polymerase III epsilon subunit-like protein